MSVQVSMARLHHLHCDCCGRAAPDVVGPILLGFNRWGTFAIDGVHEGRRWETNVLLCGNQYSDHGCARDMEAFVAGRGPRPKLVTTEGGRVTEAEFAAQHAAAASLAPAEAR
jgi:hypothetical protein